MTGKAWDGDARAGSPWHLAKQRWDRLVKRGEKLARRLEPRTLIANAYDAGPSAFTRNTQRLERLKQRLEQRELRLREQPANPQTAAARAQKADAQEAVADTQKAVARCRRACRHDLERDAYLTEEDQQARVDAFVERDERVKKLCANPCAACGCRDPEDKGFRTLDLAELAQNHWLQLSGKQEAAYEGRRALKFHLVDEEGTAWKVCAADFDNVCEVAGRLFHVDPDYVNDGKVRICSQCISPAWAQAPKDSIAAGDFGRLRVVGTRIVREVNGVEKEESKTFAPGDLILNVVERLTLAPARAYTWILKVSSTYVKRHSARRFRTSLNTIVFAQEYQGPGDDDPAPTAGGSSWEDKYGERALEMALRDVQPFFVGPLGERGRLEKEMLRIPSLKLRPERIFNALQIFKHVPLTPDPRYRDTPTWDWMRQRYEQLQDRLEAILKEKAIMSEDTHLEATSRPSDIANVRQQAQANPEAEAGADEPDLDEVDRPDDGHVLATSRGLLPKGTTSYAGLLRTIADFTSDAIEDDEKRESYREKIRRVEDPLSDYKEGGPKVYGAWPDLFPRRAGLPGRGTIGQRTYRRMALYGDGRFCDATFLFVNANVKSVLAVNKGIGWQCRTSPYAFDRFRKLVTSPEFQTDVLDGLQDPGGSVARHIVSQVLKFINFSCRDVPYSAAQKAAMQTRLFAEQRHFGPASTFDTWTFDDVHDEKALRCGQFRDRSDEEFAELMNAASSQDKEVQRAHGVDENTLQDRACENFFASAVAFNEHRRNCQDSLNYLKHSRRVDGPPEEAGRGVRGRIVSYSDVVEDTERGVQHSHGCTRGGATPGALADIASDDVEIFLPVLGRDGTLKEFAEKALDTQTSCELPLQYHLMAVFQDKLKVAKRRDGIATIPDPRRRVPVDDAALDKFKDCTADDLQIFLGRAMRPALDAVREGYEARRAANEARLCALGEEDWEQRDARESEREWIEAQLKECTGFARVIDRKREKLREPIEGRSLLDEIVLDFDVEDLPEKARTAYIKLAAADLWEERRERAEEKHAELVDAGADEDEVQRARTAMYDARKEETKQHNALRDACAGLESRRRIRDQYRVDPFGQPSAFDHHAYLVVTNRNVHECCKTCTKGKLGKSGCRLCYPVGHDVDDTRLVELKADRKIDPEIDPEKFSSEPDGIRCRYCWNSMARQLMDAAEKRNAPITYADALNQYDDRRSIGHHISSKISSKPTASPVAEVGFKPLRDDRCLHLNKRRRLIGDPAVARQIDEAGRTVTVDVTDEETPATVDDVFHRNTDEATAVELQAWLRDIMKTGDFAYLLYRPDSRVDALRKVLEELRDATPEQLDEPRPGRRTYGEDLRAAWGGFCRNYCMNGNVTEFDLVSSGCARCAVNPMHLGAGLGARAAAQYTIKYMKKKDDDIASALTLIALANRHIREYPSTAEDAETEPENRLTKHFAEYLANRMSRELDAVQAAAILLNHPLASSSHKEVFMRVSSHQVCRAAARSGKKCDKRPRVDRASVAARNTRRVQFDRLTVKELQKLCEEKGLPTERVKGKRNTRGKRESDKLKQTLINRLNDDAARNAAIDAARRAAAGDDDTSSDEEGEVVDDEMPRAGAAAFGATYKIPGAHDGRLQTVVVSDAEHYGFRDKELRDINAVEFKRNFYVRKLRNDDEDQAFLTQWQAHCKDPTQPHPNRVTARAASELIDRARAASYPPPYPDDDVADARPLLSIKKCDWRTLRGRAAAAWYRKWTGELWDYRYGRTRPSYHNESGISSYDRAVSEWEEYVAKEHWHELRADAHVSDDAPRMRYGFRKPHPLAATHYIAPSRRESVVVYTGSPPPSLQKAAHRLEREDFFDWMASAFVPWILPTTLKEVKELVPWSSQGRMPSSEEEFTEFYAKLEEDAGRWRDLTDAEATGPRRIIAAGRLFAIEKLDLWAGPNAAIEMCQRQRRRHRALWKDRGFPVGYDADEEIGARAEAATLKRMAELNRHVADVSDARVQAQRANGVRSYEQLRDRIEHTLPRLPAAADRQKNQTARRRTRTCRLARSVDELRAKVTEPPPVREMNRRAAVPPGGAPGAGGVDLAAIELPKPYQHIEADAWERELKRWERKREGPPPMNPEQRKVAATVYKIAEFRARAIAHGWTPEAIYDAITRWNGGAPHVFITGPGGAGKSAVVKLLMEDLPAAKAGHVLVTAHMGAAVAPFRGPTINGLFGFGRDRHKKNRFPQPNAQDESRARDLFKQQGSVCPEDVALLVIEEISHVEASQLGHMDNRLRAIMGVDVPFGGVPVLFSGDFHQLEPPGDGSKSMPKLLAEGLPLDGLTPTAVGQAHFEGARRFRLWRNMRGRQDEDFIKWLDGIREGRIDESGLNRIKQLSGNDPAWLFAPVGVKSNVERHLINHIQLRRFAEYHGLPFVRWRAFVVRETTEINLRISDEAERDAFFEDEPGLWEYFVAGAPVCLRDGNICPQRGLVNNTQGLYYGLHFDGDEPEELAEANRIGGFREVTIDAPDAVLVRVGSAPEPKKNTQGKNTRKRTRGGSNDKDDDPEGYYWHSIRLPDLSSRLPMGFVCGDPNAQVIPLKRDRRLRVKTVSHSAAQYCIERELVTRTFPIDIAFAITDYKLQGLTLLMLLLNLPKIGKTGQGDTPTSRGLIAMTFAALYVLVSRGVSFESLRWLQCDPDRLALLPRLALSKEVAALDRSYDNETGLLSRERCRDAIEELDRERRTTKKPTAKKPAARRVRKTAATTQRGAPNTHTPTHPPKAAGRRKAAKRARPGSQTSVPEPTTERAVPDPRGTTKRVRFTSQDASPEPPPKRRTSRRRAADAARASTPTQDHDPSIDT